ncbi:MAG: hypothetical protein AAFR17_08310 [Pseudomonadota bacterium]
MWLEPTRRIAFFKSMFRTLALLAFLALPSTAQACGGDTRCEVDGGYYLASPPPDWDGTSPLPVVVFYHGWNSSPEGMFRNKVMIGAVHRRGAMFVAPWARTGYWRQIGTGRAENGRDELAYAQAVLADLKRRWPVDANRVLASGFSRGASMVWNLACYGDGLFTAFVPIAGGFWNSDPQTCPAGPVNLRHIHGTADRVVAYDEVGIYNSMPIPSGMELLRKINGCGTALANSAETGARYTCQRWRGCSPGSALEICLHPGGHSIPAEWVAEGLDWMLSLETATPTPDAAPSR